jgi:predicted O-methyltransferase YrrM
VPVDAQQLISSIYANRNVTGRSGATLPLHSEIDLDEGRFLHDIIRDDPSIVKTLEVGCAFGLSSLQICSALQGRAGARHTIIDPFQNSQWDGVGTSHLDQAGLTFYDLVESKSEFALPRLTEEREGAYDFIFVDGWHTFDHTLIDCFYATRLLRVGGYLAIDDANWPGIRRVVSYLENYPCYETFRSLGHVWQKSLKRRAIRAAASPIAPEKWETLLQPTLHRRVFEDRSNRMIALRKTSADTRNWDWHCDRF